LATKLYIGNLSFNVTQTHIRELFSQVGEISDIVLITDRWTSTPKGFGFVDMETKQAAQEAIKRFNGYSLFDRPIIVHEATLREQRMGDVITGTDISGTNNQRA
jgi:RNA recognition motif-containing protein